MEKWQSIAKRRWLWVMSVAAVATIAVVTFFALRTSPPHPHVAFARQAHAADYAGACPAGAPIPVRHYDLGRTFAGLDLTSQKKLCLTPPTGVPVAGGPAEAVGYVSVVYGSCRPTQGAACYPPLNVQSWPECARNPNSYGSQEAQPGPRIILMSDALRVPTAPWIPARTFEGGRRLEIYSGDTTIIVFSSNPRLARAAASALARKAASQAPSSSAPRLRAEARQPGDASTCHYRLRQVSKEN